MTPYRSHPSTDRSYADLAGGCLQARSWRRPLVGLTLLSGLLCLPATALPQQERSTEQDVGATNYIGGDVSELLETLRRRNFAELRRAIRQGALADDAASNTLLEGFLETNAPFTRSGGADFAAVASALRDLASTEPQIVPANDALDLVRRGDAAAMSLLRDRLMRFTELSTLDWSPQWSGTNAPDAHVSLERWTLREWLVQIAQVHVYDQTDLAARDTLDASVLAKIAALCRSIVSIQYLPPGADRSRSSQKGVGFLWNGRVLTAAHVVSAWARDEGGKLDLGRLLLVLPDESGGFDPTSPLVSAILPIGEGSYLLPRWDTAILALKVELSAGGGAVAQWLKKAQQEPLHAGAGDQDLRRGLAFAITAVPLASGTRVALVTPGPIIFAPSADVPPLPEMALGSPEFMRAFRFEVFARLLDNQLLSLTADLASLPAQAYDRLVTITDGGPAYVLETGNSGMRRRFCLRSESITQLVQLAPDDAQFAADRRVEVFGCDLVTMPGMSGSPVFLLEDGVLRVVGVHVSAARSPSARVVFPHTRNVALAVPFHRILPHIK